MTLGKSCRGSWIASFLVVCLAHRAASQAASQGTGGSTITPPTSVSASDFQLDLVTGTGKYCKQSSQQLPGAAAIVLVCNSTTRGLFDSLNIVQTDPDSTSFGLRNPLGQQPQFKYDSVSGLVLETNIPIRVEAMRPPFPGAKTAYATFTFEPVAGSSTTTQAGNGIRFTASGTPPQYMKIGDMYCGVASTLQAGTVTLENVLACNLPTTTGAARFQLLPIGPARETKRLKLKSLGSNAPCGTRVLGKTQGETQGAITCDGGISNTSNSDNGWFDNVLSMVYDPKTKKPLTSKTTTFTVQSWYTNLPSGFLVIDTKTGQLLSSMTGTPTSLMFMKANPSSSSGPISPGDTVYLKSRALGGYCGVNDKTKALFCTGSKKDADKSPSKYTFVYSDEIASSVP